MTNIIPVWFVDLGAFLAIGNAQKLFKFIEKLHFVVLLSHSNLTFRNFLEKCLKMSKFVQIPVNLQISFVTFELLSL